MKRILLAALLLFANTAYAQSVLRHKLEIVTVDSATQYTLDAEVRVGDYLVIEAYATDAELREVTAVSGSTVTVGSTDNASHSVGDTVLLLKSPIRYADHFGGNSDTAIQAAIDDADANEGDIVYLPDGTTTIATQLTLPVGVSLFGYGRTNTVLDSNINTDACLQMIGRSANETQTENALQQHEVAHFQIRTPTDQTNCEGIQLLGCRHAFVHDITVWSDDSVTPADNGIGFNVIPGDNTNTGGHKGSAYNAFNNITAGNMRIGVYFDMTPDNDSSTFVNRNAGYNWRLQSCDTQFKIRGFVSGDGTSDTARSESHQIWGLRTADSAGTAAIDLDGVGDMNLTLFCEDPSATNEIDIGPNCVRNKLFGAWNSITIDSGSTGSNYLINPVLDKDNNGGAQLFDLRVNQIRVDDEVRIRNTNSSAVTSLTNPVLYGTSSGGSGAFADAGNLVLQPRISGADRSVFIIAGTSANEVAQFAETQIVLNQRLFEAAGGAHNVEALSAAKSLFVTSPKFQKLDPNGSNRNVDLPAEASSDGLAFYIFNTANAAENLVVRDDTPSTIATLNQDEAVWVICDGTTWEHMGILNAAQN